MNVYDNDVTSMIVARAVIAGNVKLCPIVYAVIYGNNNRIVLQW